jgi:hypothetical protein
VNYPIDLTKPLLKAEDSTKFIYRLKPEIKFLKVQSLCFELNLQMVDSYAPEMVAFMLYHQYQTGESKISELLKVLKQVNPLGYELESGLPFYEVRLINLLTAFISGMTPDVVWQGDAGLSYYIKELHAFLLNNTQLDLIPAEQSGGFLKLTLQINFTPNAQYQI